VRVVEKYSKVKMLTNKYYNDGVLIGYVGYIIEIYDDGNCEVEFSDSTTGITFAQIVVEPSEVKLEE
jgi:hypothetical protein